MKTLENSGNLQNRKQGNTSMIILLLVALLIIVLLTY